MSLPNTESALHFTPLIDLNRKGMYTERELETARNYLLFPQVRARVITEIVDRATNGINSNTDYERLLSPDHFKRAAENTAKAIWGHFLILGQAFSGFLAIYCIIILVKVVISQTLSSYHLYRLFGCTWRVIIGLMPFLAKFYIFHKHEREIRKHQDLMTANTDEERTADVAVDTEVPLLQIIPLRSSSPKQIRSTTADQSAPRRTIYPTINTIYTDENEIPFDDVEINGIPTKAFLDTGSGITCISEELSNKCGSLLRQTDEMAKSVTGHNLDLIGQKRVKLQWGLHSTYPVLLVLRNAPHQVILGMDLIHEFGDLCL